MTGVESIVLGLSPALVYAVAAGMGMAESAAFVGLLLPGETVLFLAGVLAGLHVVSPLLLGVLALVGAVAGDGVGYAVGRRWGPSLRASRLGRRVGGHRWDRALGAVHRRGVAAVVLGRWVGVLRALVPMAAGMSGMRYRRFMAANAVGAAVWVGAVVSLGYVTAASWAGALRVLPWVGPAVLLAAGVALGGRALLRRWRRRRSRSAEGDAPLGALPSAGPERVPALALSTAGTA